MAIFLPKLQQTILREMPRIQSLLDESILDLVQSNLLDDLLTKVFVEGVLPFYLRQALE
jgi:hypothetical protein